MKRSTKKLLVLVLVLFSASNSLASLDLVIDLSTDESDWLSGKGLRFDWVDGTGVTRTSGILDNSFGTMDTADSIIMQPFPEYVGAVGGGTLFDFSPDFSMIEGIEFYTFPTAENPISFLGTPEEIAVAIFLVGEYSMFRSLSLGTYELAPVGDWDGGINITVTPEPGTVLLFGFGGLVLRRRKR